MRVFEALRISLLSSACTVLLAALFRNILHTPYPLTINVPVVLFFIYLVTDARGFPGGKEPEVRCMRAVYWELAIILATVLLIGMHAAGFIV